MSVIPVICETCGTVWFTNAIIDIAPGATATMSRCGVKPCPSCGGIGTIPEGAYENTRVTLTDPQQIAIIFTALSAIKQLIDAKAQPDEIVKTIDEQYPFLAYLKRFLPKDLKDLSILVALLLAFTHSCHDAADHGHPPADVQIQEKTAEALRDIVSRLPPNPPSSQPPPPQ